MLNDWHLAELERAKAADVLVMVTMDEDMHAAADRIKSQFGIALMTPFEYARFVRAGKKVEDYFGPEAKHSESLVG